MSFQLVNAFDTVAEFERTVADYYGAPYAVATDSCTHAMELCLRLLDCNNITVPNHTYVGVPMMLMKLGLDWQWLHEPWQQYYTLGNTPVIDAAVYWQEGGYIADSYMCLSFQYKKHLSLGRGGMILLNNAEHAETLQKMSYDGRARNQPWGDQLINILGYHYYMTPETAAIGLQKFPRVVANAPVTRSDNNYPDLIRMPIFNNAR